MTAPPAAAVAKAARGARRLRRLPRALIPIFGTTLVDLLGYTLMIPLLPAVAERYGASDLTAGALLSVPAFCSMLAAPLWGRLSDRVGRKPILLCSQAISLAGYLLLAFSHSLLWMFAARIISGCGAGNMSAAQSYIADVTRPEQRSEAFALYGVIFGVGFVFGPVVSGYLLNLGIAVPFFLAAALEILNLLLTSLFLPWQPAQPSLRKPVRSSLWLLRRPDLWQLFIRQFLFIFGVVYFLGSFALFLHHALRASVTNTGWLLASAGVVGALVQALLVARLARRIGEWHVGEIGMVLLTVAYASLMAVTNVWTFFGTLVVWAVGAALLEPTLMSLLASRAPTAERGAVMGLGDAINGVALVLAPLAGSGIIGANPRLLGILPACAILAALWFGRRPRSPNDPRERTKPRR